MMQSGTVITEEPKRSSYDGTEETHNATMHRAKKIRKPIGQMDWPFKITIDLGSDVKPKVAFWSGEDRKYYPENPGHSKLAQVYVAGSLKGDSPAPNYDPPPIGVQKPISRLGYGIGGLLCARFKKFGNTEKRPDPGAYQVVQSYPPPEIEQQPELSFGSSLVQPRFGRGLSVKPPGPGSYNIIGNTGGCKELKFQHGFGSKRCIVPTTVTVCTYTAGELCTLCGQEQLFDYYRTKSKVKHPTSKVTSRPEIVVLCRQCYCHAWNGHHQFWNSKSLLWLFQKCRHCSYFHDHRNLPLIINKARVKNIKKLTAKESVMAKYFSDHCQPELKG